MAEEKKLFARKSTGLVREIGFFGAIIIVICNVVGLGWQKRVFQFTGKGIVPESSYIAGLAPVTMSFILSGIVVLLTVYVFAVLGAAMPRSGGGYVYISRILHPYLGFIGSWVEFFSIAISYGLIATAVFEAILIYAWMAGLGTAWATAEVLLIGGMILVALFAAVAALGVSMAGKLLQVMFVVPLVITVGLYVVMLAATPASMESGILALTGKTAKWFTEEALKQGMATAYKGGYWDAVNVCVLGIYWAYIGFAASTFVAGEVKEASKALPKTLFVANIFIILLYVTINWVATNAARMAGVVGDYSFFSAYAFLSYGGGKLPPGVGKAWMPNIGGFAAAGMGMQWFLIIIPVFAAFWVANDIPPFILTSSRIIFAQAFDRVLPERLADVNERWHSPINAIVFTMLVAFIGNFCESDILVKYNVPLLSQYINSTAGVASTDIWDALFFLLASISGMLFVFRKREIYEKSAYKPPVGVIVLVGLLATVGNLWLMYALAAGLGWLPEMWIFTSELLIVGTIVYAYFRYRGSKVGVDYRTIYAEIPPE